MLNLLPPQQKNELREEENWKLSLILMTVFLFFIIVLFCVLLLIDIILMSDLEVQKISLNHQEQSPDILQIESLKKDLSRFNQTVFGLEDFYLRQFEVANVVEKISDLILASDLYLTDFNFSAFPAPHEDGSIGQISLAGFASKRESLLNFKKNLEQIDEFHSINFSASNWVKPTDINFKVTFKVNDNQEKN